MDQQSTESGALIGSNDDLLTEILLRLPATSILRFKSVSKHWRWLLSHRSFTIRFDKLSKSPGIFYRNKYVPFDVEDRSPPPFRSLDFFPDPYGIKILQSCNGLLLCRSDDCEEMLEFGCEWERFDCNYYVFNPTTKQFDIIPSVHAIVSMGLAFHQTDCVHYKLVCVLLLDDHQKLYQIQVYSSDTGEWKISIESFSPQTRISGIGVYWNGAIHWAHCPLYYKVDVEELHSVPLPVDMRSPETVSRVYLGESRGHLHLIWNEFGNRKLLHRNVYEMLSDHSGWFLKYQVEFDELPHAFRQMIPPSALTHGYSYEVVDMVRGEKDEDAFLVVLIREKLIKYNIHDKSFNVIFILPSKAYYVSSSFHRYTEALSSIFLEDI